MESIGERITKARRYLGMNQKELCEKAVLYRVISFGLILNLLNNSSIFNHHKHYIKIV